MKRFQHILVVAEPGFGQMLRDWSGRLAEHAGARRITVLRLERKPDPLLTRALGEPVMRRRVDFTVLESSHGMEVIARDLDAHDDRALVAKLEAGGFDLVVVAAGGPGFRAVAERLCRKAPCPVLVLPAGSSLEIRRILIAVDFTEFSRDALEIATPLARSWQVAKLDLLHCWTTPEGYGWRLPDDMLEEQVTRVAHQQLAELAAREVPADLAWECHIRRGPLAYVSILESARDLDAGLLVIANRGKSALAAALLGSTAAEVVRHAEQPCLVVKRKGAGTGLLREILGLPRLGEPA